MKKSAVYNAFLKHNRGLKTIISRIMLHSNDIEDISHEVFIRAFKAEQSQKIDHPKAFLFRIAKNLAINEVSKSSYRITDFIDDIDSESYEPYTSALEDDVISQEKLGLVCQSIASLPPKSREAVLLKKVYGFSVSQIAEHMNITESTVETHLYKGMIAVNRLMKQQAKPTSTTTKERAPARPN